jgi:hypothetical protein
MAPCWAGLEQVPYFSLSGDVLVLRTPPMQLAGGHGRRSDLAAHGILDEGGSRGNPVGQQPVQPWADTARPEHHSQNVTLARRLRRSLPI